MTREEARQKAEIMLAYADGKKIEFRDSFKSEWGSIDDPEFAFQADQYRIKKEPKYRPFKDGKECFEEMRKHEPFGWVCDEYKYIYIVAVYSDEVEFSPEQMNIEDGLQLCRMSFKQVLEHDYKFVDGTPFGIKEEE